MHAWSRVTKVAMNMYTDRELGVRGGSSILQQRPMSIRYSNIHEMRPP